MSGLRTIHAQISIAGDFLVQRATEPFETIGPETRIRKRGGLLGQLQRLFAKVQRREITVEEAMLEAEMLLGVDAAAAPEFMQELNESLRRFPKHPQQMVLPDMFEEDEGTSAPSRQLPSRLPRHPPGAPPRQLRIEIWRDSKGANRRIRVSGS